jgi:hypothetical protein
MARLHQPGRAWSGVGHSALHSCQTHLQLTDAFPRTLFDTLAAYQSMLACSAGVYFLTMYRSRVVRSRQKGYSNVLLMSRDADSFLELPLSLQHRAPCAGVRQLLLLRTCGQIFLHVFLRAVHLSSFPDWLSIRGLNPY